MKTTLAKFPPYRVPNPPASDYWIMQVPVISTAHMTKEDDAALASMGISHDGVLGVLDYGYLIIIEDEDCADGLSDALQNLCTKFRALGYRYLRLDPDGMLLEDLPQFDW